MKHLKRCVVCNCYTMKASHCGSATKTPHPPKYTPEDKYAKYRREGKLEERKKEGIL